MLNKKAQIGDWEEIIKFILIAPILIALLGAIITIVNQPDCPPCDCSSYQNQLDECLEELNKSTTELEERPVEYIQNTTYVDVPVEKEIYKDSPTSIFIISISFALSLAVTLSLFTIKIEWSEEMKKRLRSLEKIIFWTKIGSVVLTILILIKLSLIFISI